MRKLLLLTVMFAFIALPVARADHAKEDAAIQKRHDEWCAAWNKHDVKLLTGFFVADGEVINPFGRRAKGKTELEKLFTEEQGGPMAGTTYSGTIESIRYLDDDVAIVDVAGEIAGMKKPDGSAGEPFKHHVTWIAEKRHGKWMALGARAFAFIRAPMAEK